MKRYTFSNCERVTVQLIFKMPHINKKKTHTKAYVWEISELWGQTEDSACFTEEKPSHI